MKTTEDMIQLNREQARYYDSIQEAENELGRGTGYAKHRKANLATRVWASLRYRQQAAVMAARLTERQIEAHRRWILPKQGGTILEIGCFSGSHFTFPLIDLAGQYYGIELSPKAVESLNSQIALKNLAHKARAVVGDLLETNEMPLFDVLHAHAVLHHFENPVPLFEKLRRLMKPDGLLIFSEPSAVNLAYGLIRTNYRPFQSDSAWEWPFNRLTVECLERHFEPLEGFGWGRNSLPLSLMTGLPFVGAIATRWYLKTIEREVACGYDRNVWKNSYVTAVCRVRR